ncbi:hypothetical protein B0H14DRAFT_2610329 [Mycena olivaceomarginata]|nr:hypothetical protein B0H14DRAFT_2610329 [Mycena olivaceomarginata]
MAPSFSKLDGNIRPHTRSYMRDLSQSPWLIHGVAHTECPFCPPALLPESRFPRLEEGCRQQKFLWNTWAGRTRGSIETFDVCTSRFGPGPVDLRLQFKPGPACPGKFPRLTNLSITVLYWREPCYDGSAPETPCPAAFAHFPNTLKDLRLAGHPVPWTTPELVTQAAPKPLPPEN